MATVKTNTQLTEDIKLIHARMLVIYNKLQEEKTRRIVFQKEFLLHEKQDLDEGAHKS